MVLLSKFAPNEKINARESLSCSCLLVQIAFRATTRTPRSARSNYFLDVSCGAESKWILRGMWTVRGEKREAGVVVKEKEKKKTLQ